MRRIVAFGAMLLLSTALSLPAQGRRGGGRGNGTGQCPDANGDGICDVCKRPVGSGQGQGQGRGPNPNCPRTDCPRGPQGDGGPRGGR